MSVSIEGKTIVITGASSGIGEATARLCVAAGMRCVVNARRKDRLSKLADELGDNCVPIVGDVTEDGFNQHLLEESGDVYAIFANAGHGLNQAMIDCNMEQCRKLFELNVFSAIEFASLAAKQMVEQKQGHILFCTSCLSKFSTQQHGLYSASKSALEAMAKSMRMELKKNSIHVSNLHPIGTKTEFFEVSAHRSGKEKSTFSSQSPAWLMQPPELVAHKIVRCLRKPKSEVWTSIPMRLISTAFSAFPRVASVITTKFS